MDAAAAAPFMVLKCSMAVDGLDVRPPGKERATVTPAKDWPSIAISRKKAYGCGEHGQNLVQGLTLYLHRDAAADDDYRADDLTSSLSIALSDEARRSIEAELGVTPGSLPPGVNVVAAEASVKTVTEQLLVILLSFEIWEHSNRVYYLVYDSTDASFYMIPTLPLALKPSYRLAPVPRFTGTGAGRDHELVLLARKRRLQPDNNTHVCVCTPETRANAAEPAGLWRVRPRRMPELPYAFAVDEAFAFQGRLFWADLSQGLLHCNALRVGD